MSRIIVGPFNRVEGDLEIRLDVSNGVVTRAEINSPLYRGFEQILRGKAPGDALVYAPRICGICSVSQSMAAASALAAAQGLTPPDNGQLLQNLILAAENVADHLTHFYMFFMPDFARPVYANEPWSADIAARFQALKGAGQREFLPARAAFLHVMGVIGGHWPHTLGLQPGGMTRALGGAEQARLLATVVAFRRFLEETLYGCDLERVTGLDSAAALEAWAADGPADGGDFRRFLRAAAALGLDQLGRGSGRFLSYGAYRLNGAEAFKRGVWENGLVRDFASAEITEDHSSSWLARGDEPRHPSRGLTQPDADAADGYSWCKAPRLSGAVVETGALARQAVDGQPLVADLVARSGGNVRNRVVARLVEVARILPLMESWIKAIRPREPFCLHAADLAARMPDDASAEGLIEAARGALGHWIEVRKGRIFNYQIIAPTTWNFSPRDGQGQAGVCEAALEGAPVRPGETAPIAVQHVARSFDPCMACTVH
jgi:uptake hydrogenase large subunit